jgi:hypothetical protein
MKKIKIPETDSIKELARFFETYDSIDFEDELAEVTEPLILPGTAAAEAAASRCTQETCC